MRRGRPTAPLTLSVEERQEFTRLARKRTGPQQDALCARIVLGCADGRTNVAVAQAVGERGWSATPCLKSADDPTGGRCRTSAWAPAPSARPGTG